MVDIKMVSSPFQGQSPGRELIAAFVFESLCSRTESDLGTERTSYALAKTQIY